MQVQRQQQHDPFLSPHKQDEFESSKEQEQGSPKQTTFGSSIRKVNDFEVQQAEKTFLTAQSGEDVSNALEHVKNTYELIKAAQVILNSYKEEVQELKEEISTIKPATEPYQEEIVNLCKPKIEEFQQQLEKNPKHQDEINKIFQLSIAQLKKEDKAIDQEIIKVIDRIQILETVLGKYKKSY
ncbi:hypothetical protein TTHERM_00348190 (macronuclear) [Tetrahymena thermophila SB210]|uniref:Uncharacterized protein n=1 Tax=Tetrahymena thermophila (strain SB210) TaxID=312017 RepID=I7M9S6_TETTS|nr:hypothetical protein TTHERM_00348190 [Tetrahymena thermophila SB210]EAS02729.2 hypothetical protein TTHERM_00348190 [Tetrahymena thermophila SB210]|eukprot:XP_001022974.2 hypothetical protein TTHERM_00348190 [Tetrahymena thermophila SB210]